MHAIRPGVEPARPAVPRQASRLRAPVVLENGNPTPEFAESPLARRAERLARDDKSAQGGKVPGRIPPGGERGLGPDERLGRQAPGYRDLKIPEQADHFSIGHVRGAIVRRHHGRAAEPGRPMHLVRGRDQGVRRFDQHRIERGQLHAVAHEARGDIFPVGFRKKRGGRLARGSARFVIRTERFARHGQEAERIRRPQIGLGGQRKLRPLEDRAFVTEFGPIER